MRVEDDELLRFETEGATPLPSNGHDGQVSANGTRISFCDFGDAERVVLLLHGGLGNSRN